MSAGERNVYKLVDHLFRRASGKMVAALARILGVRHLELAEDVVQETLLQALREWPYRGVPERPEAWLFHVARNKATDRLRRDKKLASIVGSSEAVPTLLKAVECLPETLVDPHEIADDALRMMFAACHPAIPFESQLAVTLKVLGGFSSAEIARAFLAEEATIAKRLSRARERLREVVVELAIPAGADLAPRLEAVIAVLYLMFNEGYQSSFTEMPIRRDVCFEAMRLAKLLAESPFGGQPQVLALLALMCFHAARFDARLDADGNLLLLAEQDRSRWSGPLLAVAGAYLGRALGDGPPHWMQVEASIVGLHCQAASYADTDWRRIVALYDLLLELKPSPVVRLNRAIALAELEV